MDRLSRIAVKVALGLSLWTPITQAANDGGAVDMWLRRPVASGGDSIKGNLLPLDLKGPKPEELESYDVQYERRVKVRGLHLRDIVGIFKPIPENVDVILLHTRRGMVVPISIARLRKDIQVFIALEIQKDGKWSTAFPASIHVEAQSSKEVPTTFSGNKVVVGEEWRATETGFTPWRHLDSLVGIEFVESTAYANQFRNAKNATAGLKGSVVYLAHCQFCHGVKGVGATRGPELTAAVQNYGKDAVDRIHRQVQSPGAAGMYPHFMPQQKDVTKDDIKDLVHWLDLLRGGSLAPYEPSYQNTVKWTK